jgi:hypothetical protein
MTFFNLKGIKVDKMDNYDEKDKIPERTTITSSTPLHTASSTHTWPTNKKVNWLSFTIAIV